MFAFAKKQKVAIISTLLLGTALIIPVAGAMVHGEDKTAKDSKSGFVVARGVEHETKTVRFETMFRFTESPDQDKAIRGKGGANDGSSITNKIFALKIDAANPQTRLEIVSAAPHVAGKDTVSNIAKANDRAGHRVLGAFNADFFHVPTGVPLGLQITNGEIVTSPGPKTDTFLAVKKDGSFALGKSIAIQLVLTAENGPQLTLNGINKIRAKTLTNHSFLLTDRYGDTTLSEGTGVEVIIAPSTPNAKLVPGQPVNGVVEAIHTTANNPIPPGKFVLTATGSKATWIKQNAPVGKTVTFKADFDQGVNEALYAVGGADHRFADVLVQQGQVPPEVLDMTDVNNLEHHPRTIFASKGKTLYVYVIDGRQKGYSDGASVLEAARYLQSLGMDYAINVDGGGSSTYVLRKPDDSRLTVLNRPSDKEERPIANALLVVSTASE
ncbi:phosphodiester glycosidase family protein [Paenibacillus allorhizosphaerae]|uniref:Phosphodiester glycosidase domain-containing protein n=1 Tax=Paenibacillus allorhizosphaerae TaxID=2849866 RepID=A0ABM8VIH2_9BACL|nr:phosphodiester glycosidase family protein [Paenibacillus allorhizosphaerae]CAG7644204.1 hypothetical protein PAECIP111802_03180 [Paenibacillus allorhizosphaerae]